MLEECKAGKKEEQCNVEQGKESDQQLTKGGIGERKKTEEGTETDTEGYIARRTQRKGSLWWKEILLPILEMNTGSWHWAWLACYYSWTISEACHPIITDLHWK